MTSITFTVHGRPAPKGSYRAVPTSRGTRFIPQSRYEKPWRESVALAACQHTPMTGRPALKIQLAFYLQRPKTVTRPYPTVAPDVDKLGRSTLDGLVDAGLIPDDSLVVELICSKRYAEHQPPGCKIRIQEIY